MAQPAGRRLTAPRRRPLDACAMPARTFGATLDFLGTVVRVEADDEAVLARATSPYRAFRAGDGVEPDLVVVAVGRRRPPAVVLRLNPRRAPRTRADHLAAYEVEGDADGHANWVATEIDNFVLLNVRDVGILHAAAVRIGGGAVVMPASPGSGKTTLALALLEAGHGFLTDEYAAIGTSDLTVRPFPRALYLKASGAHLFPHLAGACRPSDQPRAMYQLDPEAAYPGAIAGPAPARLLIFPRYVPGRRPAFEPLAPAEALRRLLAERNFLSLGWWNTAEALEFLVRLLDRVPAYALVTGPLAATAAVVEDLARSAAPVPAPPVG